MLANTDLVMRVMMGMSAPVMRDGSQTRWDTVNVIMMKMSAIQEDWLFKTKSHFHFRKLNIKLNLNHFQ